METPEQQTEALTKKQRQELKKEEKTQRQEQELKKKKLSAAIVWSLITLFIAGTIIAMVVVASKKSGVQFVAGNVKAADASDWVKGAPLAEAKVVLTEYSDFQCPACGLYYPLVKQLGQEFKNLAIIYRHFPLPQHKNAQAAAQAAEAAGKQGKFWEMHDMLFDNQKEWSESSTAAQIFNSYAEKIGLDVKKYTDDFNSSEVKSNITADYESGISEINGTPTFFINNKKIENPRNYEELKNTIQQAGGTI